MSIAENLRFVEAEVADAAARVGRLADEITLIAVSKTWPVDVIHEAVGAGHRIFGENKVQEIVEKVPAMSSELKWHLIGHLQKNKTRKHTYEARGHQYRPRTDAHIHMKAHT